MIRAGRLTSKWYRLANAPTASFVNADVRYVHEMLWTYFVRFLLRGFNFMFLVLFKWLRHAADPFPTPRQGGGPPLMRKVRQRHVLWVPKMGVKINIKCSKNMTKSVYPPKCLPCITGYIQTMFLPLHFHRFFSTQNTHKHCRNEIGKKCYSTAQHTTHKT